MTETKTDELGFDPDALRAKYREERDKRLRGDGNEQYIEVKGAFAHYVEDPYVDGPVEREPLTDDVEVVVIGGGFGGLLVGARLREAGLAPSDIRVIERGGDFGGTWYWNRYPGAQCDVESYIYLPLLEELDYVPTEKYVHAPEILAHSRAIGEHFELYANACFQTEVTDLRWDPDASRRAGGAQGGWVVSTNRGDRMTAHFVCMPTGPLNRPKLPGLPGIHDFAGHSFHTSRWDYDYTGGTSEGNLDKLHDKRVAIIGTGATAVQCVPHLGAAAAQLYVFQRTPSSIDVRGNRPTDAEWAAGLGEGWHKYRMDNFNTLVSGGLADEDLVNDGWTDIIGKLLVLMRNPSRAGGAPEAEQGSFDAARLAEVMELADFEKMNEIRARVDSIVEDPDVAESLKPYYRQFCKRPCFHDEYLQTFNRPNVTLVDTKGRGVERITEKGLVFDGTEYEVDCIIYATGFEVGTSYTRRAGFEVHGRGGVALSDHWAEGVRTLHGMHSHGFPNCFIMGPQQSGFTVNFPHMLDEQSKHIAHIVRHAIDNDVRTLEASADAEQAWVDTVIDKAVFGRDFQESCTPGYYNNEGQVGALSAQNGFYGGGNLEFFALLKTWRDEGSLAGLEVT
jgi:cyclohexanone monooxygenase